jgi:Cu(I)/Ag(I) efflux system membrane protein CusA/SilA
MIKRVIRFSAEHRYLVVAGTLIALAFAYAAMRTIPLDALPDLADTQVIVYARWDRSPDLIEDQVTYPITTALLGAPKVKAIRGLSDFGFSYVYVIFEDGTDLYWARSRVLEYLSKITAQLPPGVKLELGPDASSVGWVFQYALVDKGQQHAADQLRSYQDWFLRYALQSVPGVAEVATVGGQVRQYQVTVNPNQLVAYGLSLDAVIQAVRSGNNDVGGRLVELSGREYMVRGRGYVKSLQDLENIVLRAERGAPVRIKDVATVALGPEMRRGIADYNGQGDVVGGIVVMRAGENALSVIERVKAKLEQLRPSLPRGVEVVTTYDRSELIERAISTVKAKLIEELIVVSLIILIFLWHLPSALIPIVTIPVAVALAFVPLQLLGLNANLMSLAGIAISVGVLVDGAIVEVENAYNKIYLWQRDGRQGDFYSVRLAALLEVGPGVFFSLLVIAVAFLPVFTLVDQEGRLFRPLAWSKNLAMAIAALLAITLDPALRMLFARSEPFTFRPRPLAWCATQLLVGKYEAEERHPISRLLHRLYERPCRFVLRHAKATIVVAILIVASTVPVFLRLGAEFMPPLGEGTMLYMPSAVEPGMSVAEAQKALQLQDKLLMTFPEVLRVFGKAGRANTSTDPAPFTMMETTILLRPEHEWRAKPRWYSSAAPEWLKPLLRPFWPDRISYAELEDELNRALQLPGIANAWTMPIKGRLDMLSTGVRTPVGIKVLGRRPRRDRAPRQANRGRGRPSPGRAAPTPSASRAATSSTSSRVSSSRAMASRSTSLQDGDRRGDRRRERQTSPIEGRERFPVSVRYPGPTATTPQAGRVLVPATPRAGRRCPLEALADVVLAHGPSMIRDENGFLAGLRLRRLRGARRRLTTSRGEACGRQRACAAAGLRPSSGAGSTRT